MRIHFKSIFLFGFLPLAFYLGSFFWAEEDRLVLGDDRVQLSPKFNKESAALPAKLFSYPKLNLQWSASYTRNPFFGSEESVFILQGPVSSSWKSLESHYLRAINSLNWQLIQHLHKKGQCLLIAESPFQRLFTFLISPIDTRDTNANGAAKPNTKEKPIFVKIYSRLAAVY